jgi:hypothetical protein
MLSSVATEREWQILREYGETTEYSLRTSIGPYVLVVWGDQAWATILDRQPDGDREVANFILNRSGDIAHALTRAGVPEQDAVALAAGVWEDASARRATYKWERRWPKRPEWLANRLHGDRPPEGC